MFKISKTLLLIINLAFYLNLQAVKLEKPRSKQKQEENSFIATVKKYKNFLLGIAAGSVAVMIVKLLSSSSSQENSNTNQINTDSAGLEVVHPLKTNLPKQKDLENQIKKLEKIDPEMWCTIEKYSQEERIFVPSCFDELFSKEKIVKSVNDRMRHSVDPRTEKYSANFVVATPAIPFFDGDRYNKEVFAQDRSKLAKEVVMLGANGFLEDSEKVMFDKSKDSEFANTIKQNYPHALNDDSLKSELNGFDDDLFKCLMTMRYKCIFSAAVHYATLRQKQACLFLTGLGSGIWANVTINNENKNLANFYNKTQIAITKKLLQENYAGCKNYIKTVDFSHFNEALKSQDAEGIEIIFSKNKYCEKALDTDGSELLKVCVYAGNSDCRWGSSYWCRDYSLGQQAAYASCTMPILRSQNKLGEDRIAFAAK